MHTLLHRIFSRLKYKHELKLPSTAISPETYYGPIRLFDSLPEGLFAKGKIILQVRDPRDILTSLYFSLKYSHAIPQASPQSFLSNRKSLEVIDIDDFVVDNALTFRDRFSKFATFLEYENVLLLRYEQMVTDFELWFDQIIEFCGLSWNLKLRRCLNSLRDEADFSVDAEDVTQHKRQVQPGDFRRKLDPATIEQLNQVFEDAIETFYGGEHRRLIEASNELVSA